MPNPVEGIKHSVAKECNKDGELQTKPMLFCIHGSDIQQVDKSGTRSTYGLICTLLVFKSPVSMRVKAAYASRWQNDTGTDTNALIRVSLGRTAYVCGRTDSEYYSTMVAINICSMSIVHAKASTATQTR